MTTSIRTLPAAGMILAALIMSQPLSASETASKDTTKTAKAAPKAAHGDHEGHEHEGHDHGKAEEKGHDHSKHEGKAHAHDEHGEKGGHAHKAVGLGKTDIKEISAALRENLACMEREMNASSHDVFHGCLEAIGSLGQDLIALKTPTEPAKKKRVNGYAKNLDQMTHKVDEYKDAGQSDKALDQLKKLKAQVAMIESQFPELKGK